MASQNYDTVKKKSKSDCLLNYSLVSRYIHIYEWRTLAIFIKKEKRKIIFLQECNSIPDKPLSKRHNLASKETFHLSKVSRSACYDDLNMITCRLIYQWQKSTTCVTRLLWIRLFSVFRHITSLWPWYSLCRNISARDLAFQFHCLVFSLARSECWARRRVVLTTA